MELIQIKDKHHRIRTFRRREQIFERIFRVKILLLDNNTDPEDIRLYKLFYFIKGQVFYYSSLFIEKMSRCDNSLQTVCYTCKTYFVNT